MAGRNYATYNSLMKHMRNNKHILIEGSADKNRLMRIGYYHGVKGYRFFTEAQNQIAYSSFDEIWAVIKFDEELKSILYQPIMQLEFAIKSYVCDHIVRFVGSSNFSDVFEKGLDNSPNSKSRKYRTRDVVYAALTKRYEVSKIIRHYYNQDKPVPLWAIFEELMLGDLSMLIEALKPQLKLEISDSFGIPRNLNTDGVLLPQVILAIKDLRNAIAHNKVVFDGRYIEFKKRNALKQMLQNQTGIPNIGFDCLMDDVALICFVMYGLGFSKLQLIRIGNQIEKGIWQLKSQLPNRLFQQVAGKTVQKLPYLMSYVNSLKKKH